MEQQKKTNAEIEEIMNNVRSQLGKATPMQLNNPFLEEEIADNIRLITQKENPALHAHMMTEGNNSRNQRFFNAFAGRWREPPKLIPNDAQKYYVQFPPEEEVAEVAAENKFNMHQEGEKDLALDLCNGLNCFPRKNLCKFPLIAEALCLRDAVSLAVTLNLENDIFESDNLILDKEGSQLLCSPNRDSSS